MSMTNLELMNTLEKGRQEKVAKLNDNDVPQSPAQKPPIDWEERKTQKNKLFLKWLAIIGVIVAFSFLCVVLPLLVAHPPLGKAVLLAMPPNLFISLSWMAGAWYTFDKNRQMGMVLTMGMMPVRLAFFAGWIWLASFVPDLKTNVLLITMMIFWGLFTVPEIAMLVNFTRRLPMTSQLEPEEENRT